MVYIDENGDAGGNYTILQKRKIVNQSRDDDDEFGLFPVGTFSGNLENGLMPVKEAIIALTCT